MVDRRIQTSLCMDDLLHVYEPRIQADAMKQMLDKTTAAHPLGELFKGDLCDMELFYGFGRWYMMFATSFWFKELSTRQLLELICWAHSAYGQNTMISDIKPGCGASDVCIERMRSKLLDTRFASTERLLREYTSASGIFTGDHKAHFELIVDKILRVENLIYLPALYMMLASALTSACRITHIKDGTPWYVRLPKKDPTWSGDPTDAEPTANIIANEERAQ